ncbi:hypothetical protein HDU99_003065 [Rhizoclosmatium hyalinum]|nr:hypothetical protein HDU99_003065 [Rhizoclosmatium hyalinum]
MGLAYFANGQPFRIIGDQFGVGWTTCGDSVHRVMTAICEDFAPSIRMPSTDAEWRTISSRFSTLGGLPNVGMAMDGSYLRCRRPPEPPYLLPDHVVILGDKIFSNSEHLITPIKNTAGYNQDHRFHRYNKRHAQTRVVIEQAFAKLKTRFRILMDMMQVSTSSIPDVVMTCCILHNICLAHNDPNDDEAVEDYLLRERALDAENWEAELQSRWEDADENFDNDGSLALQLNPIFDINVDAMVSSFEQRTGGTVPNGLKTREAFAEYLYLNR